MVTILDNPFETQAEREERVSVICGPGVENNMPEDIDDEPHIPCNCGNKLCGECMRRNY